MSLRDLNWRKGFFRLWLLLSALWIVTIGTGSLYPATSRYIETVNAAHEQQTLRASISYKLLEKPHNNSGNDPLSQKPPPSEIAKDEATPYTLLESQAGVTVTFEWYEAQPPTEADLDEVFKVALGMPPQSRPK